jgi:hypothetical protein
MRHELTPTVSSSEGSSTTSDTISVYHDGDPTPLLEHRSRENMNDRVDVPIEVEIGVYFASLFVGGVFALEGGPVPTIYSDLIVCFATAAIVSRYFERVKPGHDRLVYVAVQFLAIFFLQTLLVVARYSIASGQYAPCSAVSAAT